MGTSCPLDPAVPTELSGEEGQHRMSSIPPQTKTIIHFLTLGIISSFQSEKEELVRKELKTSLKLPIFRFESEMKGTETEWKQKPGCGLGTIKVRPGACYPPPHQ